MAFTCYASIIGASVGSVGPPAQIINTISYSVVNTVTNAAVTLADGTFTSQVNVFESTPIASQSALLPVFQAAIQAQEPATPSLSFIWIGL